MIEPIRGKVARILNSREMVLNVGTRDGVAVGMRFEVMDAKGEDVCDPDTGELLGSVERPKVGVEIFKVQQRLAVASTYKKETVNVGGSGIGQSPMNRLFMPAKWTTRYETLKTEEKTWEDLDEEDSYVKIGDPVVQVSEDTDVPEVSESVDESSPAPELRD
jgi:hypothetical protein